MRGRGLKGNHVHSIVKKKRLKDEKLEQEYLEGTGKLITIEMPDVIPTVMADLIEASYVRNALDDHNEADNFSVL